MKQIVLKKDTACILHTIEIVQIYRGFSESTGTNSNTIISNIFEHIFFIPILFDMYSLIV